ncbi:molybdate ABC transporter substrate-binding protein [Azospirillum canadense]|uniref:molybdate ABC transporter substrate-binding protein n=1 Tax=Azospirillum canadense TaxID=403962 RepID=UPI0022272331|nr:molybdate ABC transporter substrate-binding protein [Azospirillum canadense]MCW2243777.1 ABC-type molybdate transport system substrate-binding protein [Azospirillum canadense]
MGAGSAAAEDTVRLFAAGSLKPALTEVARDFEAMTGIRVEATFGPSGALKDRLAGGAAADVFASANMEHPRALAQGGQALPPRPFARNQFCALARPPVALTSATLLDRLLDPAVRVGTSTPKADPAGDYAWELFAKADALRPGSGRVLRAKAMQLTGAPDSPKPPDDRSVYGWLMEQDRADVFLTYCTNARLAVEEEPVLKVVAIPESLAVGALYGLIVLKKGNAARGNALADHILSEAGQAVLERYGFTKP